MEKALSDDQIRHEIKNKVAELTERDPAEISDTALFIEDLGVDSLTAIELLVALEKRYKISIPEEEFRKIRNVNETVEIVLRYSGNGGR